MAAADFVKGVFNLGTSYLQRERDKKAVERERKANMAVIKGLDWEPMYASETVPTYQRTQSPVARSYIESFLAGNNPDATFSGAPGAAVKKLGQQSAQNRMFGSMDQRMAQQRAMEASTPWKVQTPTRQVVSEKNEGARVAAEYPRQAETGVTSPRLIEGLTKAGVMNEDGSWKGIGFETVPRLLQHYGGDQEALADALSRGGLKGAWDQPPRKGK